MDFDRPSGNIRNQHLSSVDSEIVTQTNPVTSFKMQNSRIVRIHYDRISRRSGTGVDVLMDHAIKLFTSAGNHSEHALRHLHLTRSYRFEMRFPVGRSKS